MARFIARIMDASTGGEGRDDFEAPDDRRQGPADAADDLFFDHVAVRVLDRRVDWELNSAMGAQNRNIIRAMG